jgi:excisionase family DNA binding protein
MGVDDAQFISPKQLAARLGVSLVTVYRMISSGELGDAVLRIGRHATRIDYAEAIRTLKKRR